MSSNVIQSINLFMIQLPSISANEYKYGLIISLNDDLSQITHSLSSIKKNYSTNTNNIILPTNSSLLSAMRLSTLLAILPLATASPTKRSEPAPLLIPRGVDAENLVADHYIVKFKEDSALSSIESAIQNLPTTEASNVFTSVFKGFSGNLNAATLELIRAHPDVSCSLMKYLRVIDEPRLTCISILFRLNTLSKMLKWLLLVLSPKTTLPGASLVFPTSKLEVPRIFTTLRQVSFVFISYSSLCVFILRFHIIKYFLYKY